MAALGEGLPALFVPLLVLLLGLPWRSCAEVVDVGGINGWTIPQRNSTIPAVAANVGDALRFAAPPHDPLTHDVSQMRDQQAYEGCVFTGSKLLSNVSGARAFLLNLTVPGVFYFSSSADSYDCISGLKAEVRVLGAPAPAPSSLGNASPGPLGGSLASLAAPPSSSYTPSSPTEAPSGVIIGLGVLCAVLLVAVLIALGILIALAIKQKGQSRRRERNDMSEEEGSEMIEEEEGERHGENGKAPGYPEEGSSSLVPKFRKFKLKEIKNLTDKFSPDHIVGRGAFAVVYQGEAKDGLMYAIKRHLPKGSGGDGDRGSAAAFEREVVAISQFQHKNLMRLLGYCTDSGHQIQVMELAANGSLEEKLHRGKGSPLRSPRSHLTMHQRLHIALGVAEGLQYLHSRGVVHRDIKPANILLDESLNAKVADFGLMKEMHNPEVVMSAKSMLTRLAGTPGYLDPEYASSSRVTKASDIYSLGVLLLELITGRKAAVKDEADLALAAKYKQTPREDINTLLSELSFSGSISVLLKSAQLQPAAPGRLPAQQLKDWVVTLLGAHELESVLDPGLFYSEYMWFVRSPENPEAEMEQQALGMYFKLALQCVETSGMRPRIGAIVDQLKLIALRWPGKPGDSLVGREDGRGH